MFVFIPVMFFTVATSENMIVALFGAKWTEAGIYLKIAAIGAILFPLQYVFTNILMIKGKTKIMLRYSFVKHGIRIILLLVFLKSGVLALAIVFSLSTLIGSLLYILPGMKSIKYNITELFFDFYKSISATMFGLIPVVLIDMFLSGQNIIFIFVLQAISMGLVYLIVSILIKNEFLNESLSMVRPLMIRIKK